MGWDGIYRGQGIETAAEKVANDLTGLEVVAQSRSGSTFYVAARNPARPFEVFALVILTRYTADMIESKVMDEGMEPYFYNASKRVMDALTITTREGALRWRAAVAKHAAEKAARRSVAVGERVTVKNCSKVPAVEVVKVKRGGSILGRCLRTDRLYNVPARMVGDQIPA